MTFGARGNTVNLRVQGVRWRERPRGSRGDKPPRLHIFAYAPRRCVDDGFTPIGANLTGRYAAWLPATARVARGQAPRLHIFPSETGKIVDDGFTPSRPLRSLSPPHVLRSQYWALRRSCSGAFLYGINGSVPTHLILHHKCHSW